MRSTRRFEISDYENVLGAQEHEIATLEARLDEQRAENQRLRQRLAFVERDLDRRRQHSNTITLLGAPNGRKSETE